MNDYTCKLDNYSFDNEDLLKGLTDKEYHTLASHRTILSFNKAEAIFTEGQIPLGIYRVITGVVKKFTATNLGTDHIFYICKKNEYLGYHAVLSEELYSDSATALTDCKLEFIPIQYFKSVVESSYELSQRLLKNLAHEFSVFLNVTKLLAKYTVRERTALNLLILYNKFDLNHTSHKAIVINRKDLANMIGTAKESLVRMLKDFKEEKLITTKGRDIYIENYNGLFEASNFK